MWFRRFRLASLAGGALMGEPPQGKMQQLGELWRTMNQPIRQKRKNNKTEQQTTRQNKHHQKQNKQNNYINVSKGHVSFSFWFIDFWRFSPLNIRGESFPAWPSGGGQCRWCPNVVVVRETRRKAEVSMVFSSCYLCFFLFPMFFFDGFWRFFFWWFLKVFWWCLFDCWCFLDHFLDRFRGSFLHPFASSKSCYIYIFFEANRICPNTLRAYMGLQLIHSASLKIRFPCSLGAYKYLFYTFS